MRPSIVFFVSLSAHIHDPVKISSCMFFFDEFSSLSLSSPPAIPSSSKKSCVLSGTNSRDKKGLNESRTTASATPCADFFFLFVSHSRVSFRDEQVSCFLRLDVGEMSSFSNDQIARMGRASFFFFTALRRYDFTHKRKSNSSRQPSFT